MGTDIKMLVEVFTDSGNGARWQLVEPPVAPPGTGFPCWGCLHWSVVQKMVAPPRTNDDICWLCGNTRILQKFEWWEERNYSVFNLLVGSQFTDRAVVQSISEGARGLPLGSSIPPAAPFWSYQDRELNLVKPSSGPLEGYHSCSWVTLLEVFNAEKDVPHRDGRGMLKLFFSWCGVLYKVALKMALLSLPKSPATLPEPQPQPELSPEEEFLRSIERARGARRAKPAPPRLLQTGVDPGLVFKPIDPNHVRLVFGFDS